MKTKRVTDRVPFTTSLNKSILEDFRIVSVRLDKKMNDLFEEFMLSKIEEYENIDR